MTPKTRRSLRNSLVLAGFAFSNNLAATSFILSISAAPFETVIAYSLWASAVASAIAFFARLMAEYHLASSNSKV